MQTQPNIIPGISPLTGDIANWVKASIRKGTDLSHPTVKFNSQLDVERHIAKSLKRILADGDFSYDPNDGEIIFKLEGEISINVFDRLVDDRLVGNIIRDFFEKDGWHCVIIPARIGVDKTLIRLKSEGITHRVMLKEAIEKISPPATKRR